MQDFLKVKEHKKYGRSINRQNKQITAKSKFFWKQHVNGHGKLGSFTYSPVCYFRHYQR